MASLQGLPQQVWHCPAGAVPKVGFQKPHVFCCSEITQADSARIGFAAAWPHCWSSAQ